MGELGDWAKKNSKALILDDGESVEATYLGFKIGVNPFDDEKEIAFYKLEVVQDGETLTKTFKSASARAARFFDGLEKGTRVRITRHGLQNETKYEFAVVGAEGRPEKTGEAEDDEEFG